jgi:NhaP-type Na+/H+ or K+/H+ antiporter
MAAMVTMITAVGVWLLELPPGAALLLGAILAPTDPVLASGLHSEPQARADRVGFSLAGEGGLNDGAAFPFVMLGLGLLGAHDLGPSLLRWWSVDLLWATLGGLALGAVLGTLTGRIVVFLRTRHQEAVGLDVFLGLGLIALAYGLAQVMLASGFLAVFASGLALQRVREQPQDDARPLDGASTAAGHSYKTLATHSHHASATMRDSVQLFNGQLEKLAELTLVLLLGAILAYAKPMPAAWWFVPLVLLVLRPLSTLPAIAGERLTFRQRAMIGWFGIRGVGSLFYLLFALGEGVDVHLADSLVSLTLWTITASIVAHGLTAQPLMRLYLRKQFRERGSCRVDSRSSSRGGSRDCSMRFRTLNADPRTFQSVRRFLTATKRRGSPPRSSLCPRAPDRSYSARRRQPESLSGVDDQFGSWQFAARQVDDENTTGARDVADL